MTEREFYAAQQHAFLIELCTRKRELFIPKPMTYMRDILRDIRALIDTPEKWTTGTICRDSAGGTTSPLEADPQRAPKCYCLFGACMASGGGVLVLEEVCLELFGLSIVAFNDAPGRTHADVLRVVDTAIAKHS